MSAFTAENTILSRAWEQEEQRKKKPVKTKRRAIDSPDQALRTLGDKNASEADRLRAWVRIGSDLGAISLDPARIGALYR